MDAKAQAEGAKRVRHCLVDPLMRRGLVKPASLTKAQFAEMVDDLCARLAYMTEPGLRALEEHAAQRPAGRDKDRLPIANDILKWAAQIEPPADDASPLIRAAFGHAMGKAAIQDGWAPELLAELKKIRQWPSRYAVTEIKTRADDAIRRFARCAEDLSRGWDLSPENAEFYRRRDAAIQKCQAIRDLALKAEDAA